MKQVKAGSKKELDGNDQTSGLRVEKDIMLILKKEVTQLKKMKKGSGRINQSLILRKVLAKLTEEDRLQILAETVTGDDREKVAFENYSKKHKGIKKSEFKDLIQYGEININDYLPREMWRLKTSEKTAISKIA